MKKTFTFIAMMFLCALLSAQTINLTFTGKLAENDKYVMLSYVIVQNQTRGWTEAIIWPDTVLMVTNATGIQDWQNNNSIALLQNTPNPFSGTTDVLLNVAESGSVTVDISDIFGRVVAMKTVQLSQPGMHKLRVNLSSAGTYLMSVRQKDKVATIKMIGSGGMSNGDGIEYIGAAEYQVPSSAQGEKNAPKAGGQYPYVPGDMMHYQGFAFNSNNQLMYSTPVQQPMGTTSQNITLEFAPTDVVNYQPCPSAPIVTDIDGNYYNTLQFGQQCWMRENLRTTHYADGSPVPAGGELSYTNPHYYVNSSVDATLYGYYYNWPAVMHGASSSNANPSGVQGVCPDGWHLPSDAEWTQLTNYISSQSEYLCDTSNASIAKALASNSGWRTSSENCAPGNDMSTNNASGFAAVPGGYYNGMFGAASYNAFFWTSTENGPNWAYNRYFVFSDSGVYRLENDCVKSYGWAVRCLRD